MPVIMPEETPTQDFKERDAGVSVAAHVTHEVNEIYIAANDFEGTGGWTRLTDPPTFKIGNTQTANVTFPRPSYWWNGKLQIELWWLVDGTSTTTSDVSLVIGTHRVGSSADVTTLYTGVAIAETPNGTSDYIYETKILTTLPVAEEDDIIHIEFTNGNALPFCIVSAEIEYLPEYHQ